MKWMTTMQAWLAAGLALTLLSSSAAAGGFGLFATSRGGRQPVVASQHVEDPPEVVWSLLTEFESWPHFVPDLEEIRVDRECEPVRVDQTLSSFGTEIRTRSLVRVDHERRVLKLVLDPSVPQDLEVLVAEWRLLPEEGGTRIELRVRSRSGHPVPAILEKRLTRRAVVETLDGMAREVARRPGSIASR
jgi:ribosome-associated toxin RatA of RatAB toxin-antitoxin module